jgi:epsilon-lactone hydrolase
MSIRASVLRWLLLLSGFKYLVGLAFKYPPHGLFRLWPRMLSRRLSVQWHEVAGRRIATITPAGASPGGHVIYLHGGGYALGFLPMFIRFVSRLVSEHNLRVSLLDYPLAPAAGVNEVQHFVNEAYRLLRLQYPDDTFSLLGDSAGGALALVLVQTLRDTGGVMPHKTVLISPWVDANMSRDLAPWDRLDVVLSAPSLRVAIDNYRRDVALDHPKISPIWGGLHGLGEVAVVAGGGELFYPDLCRLRRDMSGCKGTSLLWFEGIGLWHDWLYFDIPESRVTRQDIGRWLSH